MDVCKNCPSDILQILLYGNCLSVEQMHGYIIFTFIALWLEKEVHVLVDVLSGIERDSDYVAHDDFNS